MVFRAHPESSISRYYCVWNPVQQNTKLSCQQSENIEKYRSTLRKTKKQKDKKAKSWYYCESCAEYKVVLQSERSLRCTLYIVQESEILFNLSNWSNLKMFQTEDKVRQEQRGYIFYFRHFK